MKIQRKKLYVVGILIIALVVLVFCCSFDALASDENNSAAREEEAENQLLDEFDFSKLDESMKKLLPETKLTFQDLFDELMKGDFTDIKETLLQMAGDQFIYELRYHKQTFLHLIFIAMLAAVFSNFSNAFQNRQISDTGFYVLYILLLTLSLKSFQVALSSAEATMDHLITFMQLLCPVYFLAVAIATGVNTSLVFYQLVLFLIYLVELLVIGILLPAVHVFMMVQMLNYLGEDDMLTQLLELIEKGISWCSKGLLTLVLGIGLIQRFLTPAMDSLKRSIVGRSAEAIPVIGDAVSGSYEVLLSTALLIKNSIGVAGVLVCILLILVPMVKLFGFVMLFKLAAALVQPISDKRMVGVLAGVGKSGELLLKLLYTSALLFLLTIAIVASAQGT